ncbi:MAG: penicillin-binding protein 2 [Defluviitaleaceae bacterium]|nr:penicillin-binding protein 2 [Defluviitaleaceae bacterium]
MREKIKKYQEKYPFLKIANPRIKFVKLTVLILITLLFLRLSLIHHIYADDYTAYLGKKDEKLLIKKSQTRGSIYDRHGKELVTNTPVFAIIYRYDEKKSIDDLYHIAFSLAQLIDVDTDSLTTSQLKALYQYLNTGVNPTDIEAKQLEQLTAHEKRAHVIFTKMAEAYYGGENTLKFDVQAVEAARVLDHIGELPGIDLVTLGKRHFPDDLGEHDIVGRVSKGDSRFLRDDFKHYLNTEYTINDPIGLSGIERQYEDLLRGHKARYEMSSTGEIIELSTGTRGIDLVLTLDTAFSRRIDHILEKHMIHVKKHRPGATYLREAYVVAVCPYTGEILSLNGKILNDDNAFSDHPLGTMHHAFTMGSVVKGATLLTGYAHDVTRFGDQIDDRPMIFSDGSTKASWSDLGLVDDIEALRSSSNVYFMQQAIKIGGDVYHPKTNLNINPDTLAQHRFSFFQYGLGTYTGIDLPGEQMGLRNQDQSIAKLLDFAIGQSDTYTTLQLAQYVSTIANGGNRFALRLLKEASIKFSDDERQLIYATGPHLLNQIDLPAEAFKRVQEGFRQALQTSEGTGYYHFRNSKYSPAGKTGTAEEFVRDEEGHLMFDWHGQLIETNHMTFVGYAPHDKPEIAIAVVFPQAELPDEKNPIALEVANEIIDAYFELKRTH